MYEQSSGFKRYVWVTGAGHDDLISCLGENQYLNTIKDFILNCVYLATNKGVATK